MTCRKRRISHVLSIWRPETSYYNFLRRLSSLSSTLSHSFILFLSLPLSPYILYLSPSLSPYLVLLSSSSCFSLSLSLSLSLPLSYYVCARFFLRYLFSSARQHTVYIAAIVEASWTDENEKRHFVLKSFSKNCLQTADDVIGFNAQI